MRNSRLNRLVLTGIVLAIIFVYFMLPKEKSRRLKDVVVAPPQKHEQNNSPEISSEFDELPVDNRVISLNSISDDALVPKNSRNIFFLFNAMTGMSNSKRVKLGYQDICSVESAGN